MLMIKILQGPSGVGTIFNLETGGTYVIGRAASSDIQLKSSGVSKNHSRISVLPGNRLEIEDLDSSNGTFINGLQVKRSVVKPGDAIKIHSFTLKLLQKAPDKIISIAQGAAPSMQQNSFSFDGSAAPQMQAAPQETYIKNPETLGEKAEEFFASNIYPLADSLSSKFDLRFLMGFFFLIWSTLIILFTAWPFSKAANNRMQQQSLEVARLYARQLTRVNSEFIINEEYRNLVANLDKTPGQTRGIISSYIIDTTKQQVLAPANELGRAFTNRYAQEAIAELTGTQNPNSDFVAQDGEGYGYAASPIMVSSNEGNKTVAISFVQIDTGGGKFTTAALFDQVVSSLLYTLLVSFLFLIFVYRWMNGSIEMLSQRIDLALKKNQSSIEAPVVLPAMKILSEQVSFALSKAQAPSTYDQNSASSSQGEWAAAIVNANSFPAFSTDASGVISGWNERLEGLLGISGADALHKEFSRISRDMDMEQLVRTLMNDSSNSPWSSSSRDFSFNNGAINVTVTSGSGQFLIVFSPGSVGGG